jgi:hypothetical protein
MANSSSSAAVKKAPAKRAQPKIHPELLVEIERKKKLRSLPKNEFTKALKAPRKRAKSKRVKLVSIREASSVVDQARIAFSVSAIGSLIGIILGAAIPLTTYMIAHYEVKEVWSIFTVLVLGGLLFSAKNVFKWSKDAFRDSWKAFGFVALIEGAMVFSKIHWISLLGLGILIAINAIATGANLVIKPEKQKPSWES